MNIDNIITAIEFILLTIGGFVLRSINTTLKVQAQTISTQKDAIDAQQNIMNTLKSSSEYMKNVSEVSQKLYDPKVIEHNINLHKENYENEIMKKYQTEIDDQNTKNLELENSIRKVPALIISFIMQLLENKEAKEAILKFNKNSVFYSDIKSTWDSIDNLLEKEVAKELEKRANENKSRNPHELL